jgi:hypothetical protein
MKMHKRPSGVIGWIVLALLITLIVLALSLCGPCAEPKRKVKLTIALDDSWQSKQLRSELTRDWTCPNPALKLTPKQWISVWEHGFPLNETSAAIHRYFDVRFVERDQAPLTITVPAIRVGNGTWESIDKRAFKYEGVPLATVNWYRLSDIKVRGKSPKVYTSETLNGYSGSDAGDPLSVPAPWEPHLKVPCASFTCTFSENYYVEAAKAHK